MHRILLGLILVAGVFSNVSAQHVYYPAGSLGEYETMRDRVRYEAGFESSFKNELPKRVFSFEVKDTVMKTGMDADISRDAGYSPIPWYEHRYLWIDNLNVKRKSRRMSYPHPLILYNYYGAFYSQKKTNYLFVINPVLNFTGGKETSTGKTLYQNTRGAEIWGNIGGIDKGVGFYTLFTENQMLLPDPYRFYPDSLNFVPNEFFFKPFKKQGAVDYFQARGYITFNAVKDIIKFQFGHDRHKIGNGYRSLILSDFAPQYLFFKINTDVGRLHYQNLFTQFTDNGQILGNTLFGKKYGVFHRLSFDLHKNLNVGVNEMVLFDRMDSTQSNQFDLNYLNPVIFYRSIESNLGSRDNSLMALDLNWKIRNRYMLYGQFLLDEFNLKLIKSQPNWWANKYGYQLGGRAFDLFGIKRLDLLLEYNRCRPYTYSHKRPTQSYSHFNQPLAHPLGANFSEAVMEIKYKPGHKWYVNALLVYAKTGRDSFLMGRNYGSNILRSYDTRATEFGSVMFMGRMQDLAIAELMVSYMLRHNLFIDARINTRTFGSSSNMFYSLGLRLNCQARKLDY
jgi:hypothetical protein